MGDLGGSKSRFGLGRGFFAPNQKVQKNKYVFICPINTTPPLVSQNFEIGTLSYPPFEMIPYFSSDGLPKSNNTLELQ